MKKKHEVEKKLLTDRIDVLQNSLAKTNTNLSSELKETKEKLTQKDMEVKKLNSELRKTNEASKKKDLEVIEKSQKIVDLESRVSHLTMVNEYSNSIKKQINKHRNSEDDDSEDITESSSSEEEGRKNKAEKKKRKVKCRFENTGECRESADKCKFYHPRRTCPQYSRTGSCSLDTKCKLRHPTAICRSWNSSQSCKRED